MPLTAMLKRLRIKMARFQSPRTQCCCCAVGVFAAMFGIFMLSAGICIVLNVTFMEVDTSGLPPNLHNEQGKKIVGIILICVAIAFLGLSATVSIVYFTLCSRSNQASSKLIINNMQKQHTHNSAAGITPGQERPRSRESVLQGKKRQTAVEGAQIPRPDYKKPKTYRVRNRLNHPVLPPHQEEDPEATKSTMELNLTNDSLRRLSQGTIRGQKRNEGRLTESVSVEITQAETTMIITDCVPQIDVTAVGNDFMETQFNDSVSVFDEDSVSNVLSEQYEETASAGQISPYNTIDSSFINKLLIRNNNLDILRQNHLEDSDLQPPPELPHNIDVQTDILTSRLTRTAISSYKSVSDIPHNIQVVRPANESDTDNFPSSSSSVAADSVYEEGRSNLQDLTVTYPNTLENENKSNFNSAFSLDEDDPRTG